MSDAPRRRVKLDGDELDVIEHDVASATTSQVAALVTEVRRLRSLLTAPPDDDERSAALGVAYHHGYDDADVAGAVAVAFAVRARKIEADTDE